MKRLIEYSDEWEDFDYETYNPSLPSLEYSMKIKPLLYPMLLGWFMSFIFDMEGEDGSEYINIIHIWDLFKESATAEKEAPENYDIHIPFEVWRFLRHDKIAKWEELHKAIEENTGIFRFVYMTFNKKLEDDLVEEKESETFEANAPYLALSSFENVEKEYIEKWIEEEHEAERKRHEAERQKATSEKATKRPVWIEDEISEQLYKSGLYDFDGKRVNDIPFKKQPDKE